jgi:hypothetical protein
MTWLKTLIVVAVLGSTLVQYALKLAIEQEAKYLRDTAKRQDDPRLDIPEVSLRPAPSLNLLWGPTRDLPNALRANIGVYRISTAIMLLSGLAALIIFSRG